MAYQIFLSSCFDSEMQYNREIFRADLIARFNERSGRYGESTFITDFEYGIPDGLKAEQIIDICVSNIKKADLFICILGKRYGYMIEKDRVTPYLQDYRDMLMPEAANDNLISFLEIEILAALLFVPEKATFLVWNISERENRLFRLLMSLEAHKADIHSFGSREILAELAFNRFVYYSGYVCCSGIANDDEASSDASHELSLNSMRQNLTLSQIQYLSRKLRYSIPQETVISRISLYVDSFLSKPFVLIGDSDCGKSMALAEWVMRNIDRDDIAIHCWFHEEGAGILTVALMSLLSVAQENLDYFYQDDVVYTFYNTVVKKNSIKQVFILDGLDHLKEAMDVGWLITDMDPTSKIIITLNTKFSSFLSADHVITENMSPLPVKRLLKHIYEKEGKGMEYPFIKNMLEDVCKKWSLRQVTEGIQQFLRTMKYQPGSSLKSWDNSSIRDDLAKFDSVYGIFCHTKIYLENNFDSDVVHQSISLLALTERGLTRNELSDLMQGRTEIFYQLYFILVQNEDLYMLPEAIIEQQISRIPQMEVLEYRKKLIDYFKSDGSDRAVIEICWQLVMLSDKEGLVEFLSSIKNWSLVHTNSSLYFSGIDHILTKEHWDQIACKWKAQLVEDPNRYSEKEIYTISDGLSALCQKEEAVDVLRILLSRGMDDFSMASYHQQIADLYETIGDERAIFHIEQAIFILKNIKDRAFIQNKIDTYLTGAYIYAFFLDRKENSDKQKKRIRSKMEDWLQEAVRLTGETSYVNPNYLVLCYHNIAYAYWNIRQNEKALEYVNYALSIIRPDEGLKISDLKLRAQIYNDFYCDQNEYFSDEKGMLMIGIDSDNEYLKLAAKDLEDALKLQQKLTDKAGRASYFEELADVHYTMSQNLGYQGLYMEAIEQIDLALAIQKNSGAVQDLYATYYQAANIRLGAYDKWKEKRFLKEALDCLNNSEREIFRTKTIDAHYFLEDVLKMKEYVLEELK